MKDKCIKGNIKLNEGNTIDPKKTILNTFKNLFF